MSRRHFDITPELLLRAYRAGLFPMAESRQGERLYWLDPEQRGVIPLQGFHLPKRLLRTTLSGAFHVTGNQAFEAVVAACADLLTAQPDADIATLVAPEAGPADRTNPDVVKAVLAMQPEGHSGRALYFTRSTLYGDGPIWRHIGLYGYRRAALAAFVAAPPSPLEQREGLEQLRAMELGLSIWAAVAETAPISVDSPADLERARHHARMPA